jgi:hypothetical protein
MMMLSTTTTINTTTATTVSDMFLRFKNHDYHHPITLVLRHYHYHHRHPQELNSPLGHENASSRTLLNQVEWERGKDRILFGSKVMQRVLVQEEQEQVVNVQNCQLFQRRERQRRRRRAGRSLRNGVVLVVDLLHYPFLCLYRGTRNTMHRPPVLVPVQREMVVEEEEDGHRHPDTPAPYRR